MGRKVTVTDKEDLKEYVRKANRIWDGKQGLGHNQAKSMGIDTENDMDYVIIRDDGWSIACAERNFDSCHELWKDEWREIVTH